MAFAAYPAASMFDQTSEEGAANIRRCYEEGTMWKITRWIETEVIALNCEPTYDKYTFFQSLKKVIGDFLREFHGEDVVSLVNALNREDFATKPSVCPNKLRVYRSHFCDALSERLVLVDGHYNHESPGREALKNMLLDMIRKLEFVGPRRWNERLEGKARNALRILGYENPNEHFAAFDAVVLPEQE